MSMVDTVKMINCRTPLTIQPFMEGLPHVCSDNPVLFRVDYEAGHFSSDTKNSFEDLADVLSFAFWQTGHSKYQVK